MEKTAFALGPLLFSLMLAAAEADQERYARMVLLAAAALPAVASGLSALVLCFYQLDRDHAGGFDE